MAMTWLVVLCSTGCGDGSASVDVSHDAPPSTFVVYGTLVRDGEIPPDIEITLNGELGVRDGDWDHWQPVFPSYDAARATDMIFEVRYGGALLDRRVGLRCDTTCEGFLEDPLSESIAMCVFPHGELRTLSVGCDYVAGACVGDACCRPRCFPSSPSRCDETEKCSRIVTHVDPTFGVLDCAPVGGVALGAACTVGAPGLDSGYDDCVAGAVCVDGLCVELCSELDSCSGGGACTPIAGLPAAFGACL